MIRIALFIGLLGFVVGCDISNNEVAPDQSFTKIYDDNQFSEQYYPLDIVQTPDEGFLILSERKVDGSIFNGIYVLKTDKNGSIVKVTAVPNENVHPVKQLLENNGQYYFVCMSSVNQAALLISIDAQGEVADPIAVPGAYYPLSVSLDAANFVMQSYNNADKRTVVSVFNTAGQISKQAEFDIGAGEDVEVHIINHFTRNGTQFPFQVGKTGGTYFFNGFYNYTFSLVFTNLTSGDPTGVCQGQQNLGGIGGVYPLSGNQFAISRFNFGDNYLAPTATIPTNAITSSVDIPGNTFPELTENATVVIKPFPTGGESLYASTTKSQRVVLYGFSQADGVLKGTQYLGSSSPFEIASFTFTSDGGLAVLAQTFIEGRFPRMAVFKLTKAQVDALKK